MSNEIVELIDLVDNSVNYSHGKVYDGYL